MNSEWAATAADACLQQSHETFTPLASMSSIPCACFYSVSIEYLTTYVCLQAPLQPTACSVISCSCTKPST